jgi:hypothetical protein
MKIIHNRQPHYTRYDSVSKIKSGSNELSYLSWADAWTVVMKKYPEASYEILKDEDTKMPYFSSN